MPNTLLFTIDIIGVAIFALSGGLVAQEKRMDLLGFAFLGCLAGIGGGTIRDLLLDRPVFWMSQPWMIITATVASLSLFFFRGVNKTARSKAIRWIDALGLAWYCVVGASIAREMGVPVVGCIAAGFFTSTGGGLLRDITAGRPPFVLTGGEFYGSAAIFGSLAYLMIPIDNLNIALGFCVALAVRGAGILYGYGFPVFKSDQEAASERRIDDH